MPNFDRTGPMGEGPRTGGGFGLCNPRNKDLTRDELVRDKDENFAPGRGAGMGYGREMRGGGRGLGRGNGNGRNRGRRPGRGNRFRNNC